MGAQCIRTGFHRVGVVVALLATLPACQSDGRQMYVNQASALVNGTIKVGMDKKTVIAWLGAPARIEKHGTTEFFFYNPPWQMAIGTIGRIPIAIADDKVVGFGKSFYENVLKSVDKS